MSVSSETSAACRDCSAPLPDDQRFCGGCGQRTGPARLTMGQILHDFMHALTHADHSIFSLAKDLIVRPGHVAREYVEGAAFATVLAQAAITYLVYVFMLASMRLPR